MNTAINEIMNSYEEEVRSERKNTELRVLGGLQSKSDFRNAYSAERDDELWNATAQMYGITEPIRFHKDEQPKAKATIKKVPHLNTSYVKPYGYYKRNEHMITAFVNRLKLEDELDIKPIDNPFTLRDSTQLIKVTNIENRGGFYIITAINADDEHDRLTYTRSMDEVSEFHFTFNKASIITKYGQKLENPDITRLRTWMWNKVDRSQTLTFDKALQQLIGRIATISLEMKIPKVIDGKTQTFTDKNGNIKPVMIPNPDFLGFPTYDINSRFEESSAKTCDHNGSYQNTRLCKYKSSTNAALVATE